MSNGYATKRQLWALFCMTKVKTQNLLIGFEKARDLINLGNSGKDITQELIDLGGIPTGNASNKQNLAELFKEADEAGNKAVEKLQVIPMTVNQHENPLDDNSNVVKSYYVSEGVCGFASVVIRPGNCSFANFIKKNYGAHKSYYGGVALPVRQFNQSYQKKVAYAEAFAEVVNKAGIKASVDSRLD
jgi:hypothetical protein